MRDIPSGRPLSLFWFRRDLRIDDNHGLERAMRSGHPVLPLFIFDRDILDELKEDTDPRVTFIHDTLRELNGYLTKRGSTLLVRHGKPPDIFKELLDALPIAGVYANHDYEPYAVERDKRVEMLLNEHGIEFHHFKDQVIFEKSEVLTAEEKPYTIYTPYSRRWLGQLSQELIQPHPSGEMDGTFVKCDAEELPALASIGFRRSDLVIPPRALDADMIREYDQKRDFPSIQGTSRLGIHLRFGTVSIRDLMREARRLNEVWLKELIWREFFMMILHHYPRVVDTPFRERFAKMPWQNDESQFERWCDGKTGYPLVDAGMRELNATGFMHNRVRMVVASFLTKHLMIDWRWGERYFAEKLLDYELASNNGNWQWAAGCGCDAAPYFRIFNPTRQMEKFDPKQEYVRRWVPEVESDDYPEPLVDHRWARERALSAYDSIK